MRKYEIAVVLHPDLEIDLESTLEKIEAIFTKNGGKITKKDNWGKRKLAYKINKQDWGLYVFYQVETGPEQINKINQTLRITTEVMRYLIVSLENVRYLKQPKKLTKTKAVSKAK
jgi:small subunit ribosomal protein S6